MEDCCGSDTKGDAGSFFVKKIAMEFPDAVEVKSSPCLTPPQEEVEGFPIQRNSIAPI